MFIPFLNIQAIFETHADKLEAVVYSLPSQPILIKTPSLLEIMTGKKWEKQIISHNLFKIWIATLFYIRSLETKGPLSQRIEMDLKDDQEKCFSTHMGNDFTFNYLNCYEYAIIKYLHLFKVGEKGADSPDGGETPPITHFIMNIPKYLIHLGLNDIVSSHTLPEQNGSKILEDYISTYDTNKIKYGL